MPAPSPVPPPLAALGWNDHWAALAADAPAGTEPARVIRHDSVAVVVGTAHGSSTRPIRPSLPSLAVGDWLIVDPDSIVSVLARTSLLQRRDPTRGGGQLIAANVDLVGIVCGLDRPVKTGRIHRFVVQVRDAGAQPLVVLTKTDGVDDAVIAAAQAQIARAVPEVPVIPTSARTSQGMDALREAVRDRTVTFVGESGAGKSTLVNALAGTEVAATNAVRKGDSKGRHTTTARELHVLAGHCCLVDTPGLREMGVFTDVDTIDDVFDDVTDLIEHCRFNDCNHTNEPGCAVLAAIAAGDLDPDRVATWRVLRSEAEESEDRMRPRD